MRIGRGVHRAHNFAALTSLAECTNIKSLFFDCTLGCHLGPKSLAAQIYRDGHFFLEAYGAAHGRYDAGVDVVQVGDWHFDKQRFRLSDREKGMGTQEHIARKRVEFEEELRMLLRKRHRGC